jgi:hypothetical protein
LDKFPEKFYGFVEDSVSHIEELTAQAATLKEAIAELAHMVGGRTQNQKSSAKTSLNRKNVTVTSPRADSHWTVNQRKNSSVKTIVQSRVASDDPLPMESDFKDF